MRIGSLEPGKLADVMIIDGNLEEGTPEEIDAMSIWLTMLDGEILWRTGVRLAWRLLIIEKTLRGTC